jgi:hypothetical protein
VQAAVGNRFTLGVGADRLRILGSLAAERPAAAVARQKDQF